MNILLSSAGRQVFLVNAFKEALNGRGKVYVSDYDENALSLKVADEGFIAPPIHSPKYISWILDFCVEKQIKMLVSFNVDDLLVLETQRIYLNNIKCLLVGGDLGIIKTTVDKYALSNFCKSIGLETPTTYLLDKIESYGQFSYPLLAKPRYGKGSRDHTLLKSETELRLFVKKSLQKRENMIPYIIQPFIEGQEYGIDLVNNFKSEFSGFFVRKKIEMRNGETFEAVTDGIAGWNDVLINLSRELKHLGTVDIDIIKSGNKFYIIDINYRFGGGYIFSHIAGAHLPKVYVNWLLGKQEEEKYLSPREGVHSVRDGLGIREIDVNAL